MENASNPTPCDICGKPAAVVINSVAWCDGCFHETGSCCGEWQDEETP